MLPNRTQNDHQPKVRAQLGGFLAQCRKLLKRPGIWVLGIVGTVVTGYLTTTFTEMTKPLSHYVAELSCQIRKPNHAPSEPKFTILVSPLVDDDANRSHTRRLLDTFYWEAAFHPVRICETLNFDLPTEQSKEQTIKRGQSLIVNHQADLLIFGSVILPNQSIQIWAINEHGGCSPHPKRIVLQNGFLPNELDYDTKMAVIAATLQEIASACDGQESVDWNLFERRIQKMAPFIELSAARLPPERFAEIAASYGDAMMLLYAHGRGESWYNKALEFDLRQMEAMPPDANHYRRFLMLFAYADLLDAKANKTQSTSDLHAAIEAYNKAITEAESDNHQHRKYAEAYVERAGAYLHLNTENYDPEQAMRDFERAIQIDPNNACAFEERGRAKIQNGDYDRGFKDFEQSLKLDPKRASTFLARADAFAKQGNYDLALRDFDRAITIAPNNAYAFEARAVAKANVANGDYEGVRKDLDAALKLDPKRASSLLGRAVVLAREGNYKLALKDFDAALELNPKDASMLFLRGAVLAKHEEYDRAIRDLDQAISIDPNNADAFAERGAAHAHKDDYERAFKDFDAALKLNPKRALTFFARGAVFRRKGNFERAIEEYSQAILLEPEFPLALYGRGIAYSNSGQYELAIADYNSALRLDPNWAGPLYGRGVARLKRGDAAGGNADIATATKRHRGVADDFAIKEGGFGASGGIPKKGDSDQAMN
jgi:tetratricopeptide (TPR) repeat protein